MTDIYKRGIHKGEHNLNPQQRRFVLRMFGEYKTGQWIADALKERWGLERSAMALEQRYKYNHQYRQQIAEYERRYNAKAHEHPLTKKVVINDYIQQGMDLALKGKDVRGLAALINQAKDINGHSTPAELEISTTGGAPVYEDMLTQLLQQTIKPPPALTSNQVIDVTSTAPLLEMPESPYPQGER